MRVVFLKDVNVGDGRVGRKGQTLEVSLEHGRALIFSGAARKTTDADKAEQHARQRTRS